MNAKRSSRRCPACGHHFIPWSVWRVSRVTTIPCPKCGARLTRKFDFQFFGLLLFIVILVASLDAIMVRIFHRPVTDLFAVGTLIVVLIMWPLDALTVRLVRSGKWQGWLRGYET
jgi:endogenous inhibitor of DNA gyrase (YacG/DUF329 family)